MPLSWMKEKKHMNINISFQILPKKKATPNDLRQ